MYNHHRIEATYGSCTMQYKYECFWFEPVDMLRKLALTSLLQLVDRGSAFQAFLGCILSFATFGLQQRVQPYRDREANILKGLVEAQIFLTFLIGFILQVIQHVDSSVEPFGAGFYGYVLITSLAAVLMAAAGLVVKHVRRLRRFGASLLSNVDSATKFGAPPSSDSDSPATNQHGVVGRDSSVGVIFSRGLSAVFSPSKQQLLTPPSTNELQGMADNAGFTIGGSE